MDDPKNADHQTGGDGHLDTESFHERERFGDRGWCGRIHEERSCNSSEGLGRHIGGQQPSFQLPVAPKGDAHSGVDVGSTQRPEDHDGKGHCGTKRQGNGDVARPEGNTPASRAHHEGRAEELPQHLPSHVGSSAWGYKAFMKREAGSEKPRNRQEVDAVPQAMGEGAASQETGIPQLVFSNTLVLNGALFLGILALHAFLEDSTINNNWLSLALLAMALALLIKSADVFIEGAKGLAYRAGLPEVVIGLTIVSIGTSLPEILVTSTAAADIPNNAEIGDLAIGGIYGSILVQITLILGVVVAFRGVKVRPSWLKRDGFIMFASIGLVTLFLFTGGGLNRIEGGFLMCLYIAYIYWLLSHRDEILEEELSGGDQVERKVTRTTASYAFMVTTGLLLALFAAHHLVNVASDMAYAFNVPHAVIGTTVSGLGTSLPELTIAFLAAKRSQGVAIGTLIGSNITDPLLSIGFAAVVHPLALTSASFALTAYVIIPATFVGTGVALLMMRSEYEFKRWEGVILILIYMIFLAVLAAEHQGHLVL